MKPIKKPINTIPDGAWEAGKANNSIQNSTKSSLASELKKDGYPVEATDPSEKSVIISDKSSKQK